ncbi:MAG: flagellar motor switch protein FliN [Candidatus Eisenbacteria bacterium]|uniref:Flagellar motor switch protein FliN n=1 Tax=Eiseniibacteriota bacterium TaxID=2212470 RepID=A0A948RZ04_UNCEI|nr:flagellar motor switch protein FliN [Candidatus Eisenbacteria bacterium]MBU1950953.1 flagellar motor switch protein FliN [Candidatus Eisenbacteria bacterium]MBU2692174.1 flagellar motor switch protein FliN [Candidatus Eisenbacteria bacterium]
MDETMNPTGDENEEIESIGGSESESTENEEVLGAESGTPDAAGAADEETDPSGGIDSLGLDEQFPQGAGDNDGSSASEEDIDNLLQAAAELGVLDDSENNSLSEVKTVEFPQLVNSHRAGEGANLELLYDVQLPIAVELGRAQMDISEILDLGPGSVVELDKMAGESVDLLVNGVNIGKGEVVVVDEQFGIRITHLLSPRDRVQKLA